MSVRKQQEQIPPLLEARAVVKTYRSGPLEVPALCGIDLRVEPGEMVAVVGPSGCGKTTLLNSLSGLDDIDSGEVWIDGEEIHRLSDRRRTAYRARSMGFVFQAFNLIPVFSAVENVELPLLLGEVPPKEARERAGDVLARVGLGHRLHHRPTELSGGEQQRVAIARALAPTPRIVWADEPTGNLDTHTATSVMDLLGELHADGLTVVLVTHDSGIAAKASRLVSMRDGHIESDEMQAPAAAKRAARTKRKTTTTSKRAAPSKRTTTTNGKRATPTKRGKATTAKRSARSKRVT